MWQVLIALAVAAHGIGHLLFLGNTWGYWRTAPGHAWIVSGPLTALQSIEGLLGLFWLLPAAGFLIATWQYLAHQDTWRPLALGAAIISAALIVLLWGTLNPSSAVFALAFNAAIIATLLWQPRLLPA